MEKMLKVREIERKLLAEQNNLIFLSISNNVLFLILFTHANFCLPRFPVLYLLISTKEQKHLA